MDEIDAAVTDVDEGSIGGEIADTAGGSTGDAECGATVDTAGEGIVSTLVVVTVVVVITVGGGAVPILSIIGCDILNSFKDPISFSMV